MTSAVVSFVELQMLLFTSQFCRAKTNSDGAMVCCDEVTQLLARLLQMKNSAVYLLVSSFFTTPRVRTDSTINLHPSIGSCYQLNFHRSSYRLL